MLLISHCSSPDLCIQLSISFPFSFCLALLCFPQLFVKPPWTITFPFCISFSLRWFCFLSISGWDIDLDYCNVEWFAWKWTKISLWFLRLQPNTAFGTLLLTLMATLYSISSVQFSHSVMSDSLWCHELQHARTPYPSPTPEVYSNSCASSQWCHPAI